MKSHGIQIVLVVIVLSLLAFGVRAGHLEAASISHDEGLSLFRVHLGLPGLLTNRAPLPGQDVADPQPPLYFLLLAAFTGLAGESDFALRFLSVGWSVLLVPLLFAAGTRFWNRRAGLLAAVLGALSPLYLWFAQEARMYTMLAALGLVAVYAVDRALAERRRGWLLVALVCAMAAAATHLLGLVLWPVLGAQALASGRLGRRSRLAILATLGGVALAALMAAGLTAWRLGPALALAQWCRGLPVALNNALHALSPGLPLGEWAAWPVDLLCLALLLLGLASPAFGRRRATLVAYVCIPFMVPLGALLVTAIPTQSRHLVPVAPAIYLAVARGLERCSRRLWPVALVAGVALAGTMAISAGNLVLTLPYRAGQDFRTAAQAAQRYERFRDVIATTDPESATTFVHYYRGALPAVVLRPAPTGGWAQSVADVAARFDRIWLVETARPGPPGPAEAWLRQNTFLAESASYPGWRRAVTLQLFLTRTPQLEALPPLQHTVQLSFGSLQLEGYDLPLQPTAGGECAWITLYWRALAHRDVRVSLRLVDEEGRVWGHADGVPYPAFPPAHWPVGAIMRHEASLQVPPGVPPGWYRLQLRVYDPASGRPIEPGAGAAPGPLRLGPLRIDSTWSQRASLRGLPDAPHLLRGGGMRFGEAMTLRAFRLPGSGVRPGEWLYVDGYWEVALPPDGDLTLTMELVDPRGVEVASQSGPPIAAQFPPASWEAGQLLWAQYQLLVPPDARPGLHQLRLSLRDGAGRLLPIRNQLRFWTWGDDSADLGTVRVVETLRAFSFPPMDHVLQAQSTVGIDLLGFDGLLQRAGPGDEFEVTLYWRAGTVPSNSYKVSVQLLASDGRTILAQEDSAPAHWARPTTGWGQGEIVSDPHRVALPADVDPQTATLIVALYDEDTGRRVQWLDGTQMHGDVVLGQVEIVK